MSDLRGLNWDGSELAYIDQTLLPGEEVIRRTRDWRELIDAIKRLAIRGAPAIGVAGAFAVLFASRESESNPEVWPQALDLIENARPTAVNLSYAVNRMRVIVGSATGTERTALAKREAERIAEEDRNQCDQIAAHGQELFPSPKVVLTHCNTGALVTYGIGTALGVVRIAHERGHVKRVYACEARPLGQGSRLTMWELDRLGIEGTLLPDSAAGSLLSSSVVDLVILGADRIAANGDTANKIGTLNLAILAKRYNVPFYVAAPSSTFDRSIPDGSHIRVEHRDAAEVRQCGGNLVTIPGADVYNPAFDITPGELISGIICESGILYPPYELGGMRT